MAHFTRRGTPRRASARRRRGISTAIMLLSAVILIGMMALALDMAMVTLTAQQIQVGVDSAALAAAAEDFNRPLLCPDYADLDLDMGVLARHPTAAQIAQFESDTMRVRAIEFAGLNQAQGQDLTLEDNPTNDPTGDIVLLTVDDPTAPTPQVTQWPGVGHANGVQVTIPRTTARGNPLSLWIAKSLGIANVDISPSARAAFDQRVFGFQPLDHISIPMLPILTDYNAWPSPELGNCLTADADNDKFAVAPATGAIASGQDGFPEFEFTLRQSQTAGNAHLIPFSGPVASEPTFRSEVLVQTAVGLYLSDVDDPELGGAVALASGNAPRNLNRVAPTPAYQTLSDLAAALTAIKGQKRVWPIGEIVVVAGVPSITRISDFAAGRVVDVSIDDAGTMDQDDDSLVIRVQPCLLQTSTALVRSGKAPNKWLGKVMLIR